ncbi:Vasa protein, protein [Aphelenchoides besseyi]|nr:Vasa protein, protein [Aphelenchoides besseyi]
MSDREQSNARNFEITAAMFDEVRSKRQNETFNGTTNGMGSQNNNTEDVETNDDLDPTPTAAMSAAEKRRDNARRLRGKSQRTGFTTEELTSEFDQIEMGGHYDLIRQREEQSIRFENLERHEKLKPLASFADGISDKLLENTFKRFPNGPTTVQKNVIPYLLHSKRDVNCRSPTGSGKTATFLLPLIQMIHDRKLSEDPYAYNKRNATAPYAVVFSPTRELALQLARDATRLAGGTCVRVAFCVGDLEFSKNLQVIRNGSDILVGTVGRIHHIWFGGDDGRFPYRFEWMNMTYLVLDEADRLIENAEFFTLVKSFKEHMVVNQEHRTWLFSATTQETRSEDMVVENPIGIFVGSEEAPVQNVVQMLIKIDTQAVHKTVNTVAQNKTIGVTYKYARVDYLIALLNHLTTGTSGPYKLTPRMIVFVKNKRQSDSIAVRLISEGFRAMSINGDRPLDSRSKVIDQLRCGEIDVLVATDVASRGLNIPNVDTVFNLSYIHRIGRTGRMGNVGRAISLFDPEEDTQIGMFLIKCMENCHQKPPEWLEEVVEHSNANFVISSVKYHPTSDETLPPQQHTIELDPDHKFI